MTTSPALTRRLDEFHDKLPAVPASALDVTRSTFRRIDTTVRDVAGNVGERAEDIGSTLGRAASTVSGQTRSAARRLGDFADARLREVTGQATSQAKSAAVAVDRNVSGALDDAASAIDPDRPLDDLTKDELYDLAQTHDVAGRSSMSKRELVAALRSTLSR